MNIINKFTIKNLKKNKKRTIVTIIGIALSTALICAVAGMVMSFRKTMIEIIKAADGNYHVEFQDVPQDQLKYIENNEGVTEYYCQTSLGYAQLKDSVNPDKPYLYVMAFDQKALSESSIKLKEGRMPQNSNEVVISEHIESNARVKLNIGDTIKANVGERVIKGTTDKLNQHNPYLEGNENNPEEKVEEEIINNVAKEYTIVGIIERPNSSIEPYSAPGYSIITYLSPEEKTKLKTADIYVRLKEPKQFEKWEEAVSNTIYENTNQKISYETNTSLLKFEGVLSETTMTALYSLGGIVIGIIVVSSVFVIRNSFSISVSEKTKQYGMLASVGATSKQIRKTVLKEGFIIGLIGIPLGILCGVIAIVILIWLLNYLLQDMLSGELFVYALPWQVVIISILMSAITIYFSCIIPARKASKISPIDAIKGNDDIKIKAKKIRTSKLTKKLFGMGGVIASKNLKRSRKKYRTTVISLVVSISIFIALSSFLEYGKRMTSTYYVDLHYNIIANFQYQGTDENAKEVYEYIAEKNNLNDYAYYSESSALINTQKYGTKAAKTYMQENYVKTDKYNIGIIKYNKKYFEKFAQSIGINVNDYSKIAILEDDFFIGNEDESVEEQRLYNINEGDNITVSIAGEDSENELNIQISKISKERPMGFEGSYSIGGIIVVSEDFDFKNESKYLSQMYINSKNPSELEANLIDQDQKDEIVKGKINITNINEIVDQQNRIILVISIFLYGFIIVITLIGVTNIFNTITTNMILRSKEFAMLKSIGMTNKEFNRMIRLESIMYGTKSLMIGIPIGLALSYAIYKSVAIKTNYGFMIPWWPIIISIIFVFIIVGITMKYSLNKINKQNIVETIRNDNI